MGLLKFYISKLQLLQFYCFHFRFGFAVFPIKPPSLFFSVSVLYIKKCIGYFQYTMFMAVYQWVAYVVEQWHHRLIAYIIYVYVYIHRVS